MCTAVAMTRITGVDFGLDDWVTFDGDRRSIIRSLFATKCCA
jgi:hypothetical protein